MQTNQSQTYFNLIFDFPFDTRIPSRISRGASIPEVICVIWPLLYVLVRKPPKLFFDFSKSDWCIDDPNVVDIYLLWVNGGDPVWSKKRDEIAKKEKLNITEKYSKLRFIEHDELRWALRSIEQFAPWVHKIHLLTDQQYPSWMKREHPKIQFVDHDTLFYPGFHSYNSIAMQMAVARVPGISRRTILMDDDYMFMNHVSISDFFDEMNRTVIRGFIKATEYNFSDDMSHKKKCSSLVTSSIFNYGSMLAHRVVYVIFKKTTNIFFLACSFSNRYLNS